MEGDDHDSSCPLPSELLIEVFLHLPLFTILALRRTCHLFRDLIDGDTLLAYEMELEIAGMRDNQFCSYLAYPIPKRLEAIQDHERRWMEMKPKWTRTVSFPASFTFSGSVITKSGAVIIYGADDVHWKNGSSVTSDLIFSRLPQSKDAVVEWEELDFGLLEPQLICGFGHAFRSYDLSAYITRAPEEAHSPVGTMYINLHRGATSEPHPLAETPIIELPLANNIGVPATWLIVAVDIDGENLIIITSHQESRDDPFESFEAIIYALNWTTGQLITTFVLPIGRWTLSGLLLLKDQDWLLWPDEKHNSLDVYHFTPLSNPTNDNGSSWIPSRSNSPSSSASSSTSIPERSEADLVLRLQLPEMKPGIAVFFIDTGSFPGVPCRIGPESRRLESDLGPFDADRSIIYYMVEYIPTSAVDLDGYYSPDNVTGFSIFIDRDVVHDLTLKALEKRNQARMERDAKRAERGEEEGNDSDGEGSQALEPLVIPWEEWGPQATRWIESQGEAWISTAYDRGARLISTPPRRREERNHEEEEDVAPEEGPTIPDGCPPRAAPENKKPKAKSWVQNIEVFDFAQLRVLRGAHNDPNGVIAPSGEIQEEDRSKLEPGETTYYLRQSPTRSPRNPGGPRDPFAKPVLSHLPYSRRLFDGRGPNDFLNEAEGVEWECAGVEICKDRIIGIMRQTEDVDLIDAFNIIQIA